MPLLWVCISILVTDLPFFFFFTICTYLANSGMEARTVFTQHILSPCWSPDCNMSWLVFLMQIYYANFYSFSGKKSIICITRIIQSKS